MSSLRKGAATVVLLTALTACGFGGGNNTTATAHPVPSNSNAGREVKESGCDAGAFDAAPPKMVNLDGLQGELSLRKSGVCDRIYWARFEPVSDSGTPYTVVITTGKQRYEQDSEPANPTIAAFTKGAFGVNGEKVEGCVINRKSDKTDCLGTTVV